MSTAASSSSLLRLAAAIGLGCVMLSTQAGSAAATPARAAPARAARAAVTSSSLDWSQYLHGPQHSSVGQATAFTPSDSSSPAELWHWQPPVVSGEPVAALDASPTVVAGIVYIGAGSGGFYALNESTGAVMWSRQLDTGKNTACLGRGIVATAAVTPDPVTGTSTVYVSGAHFLYALDATTGALIWKTRIGPVNDINYYNWSSPTVVAGHIYVGLSSRCDRPLIRGGVLELDQHTGRVLKTWYTVPPGSIGGSVWSSIATSTSGSDVWVSTGNECDPTIDTCPTGNQIGNSLSIVHLTSSLKLLQAWQAPGTAGGGQDFDFGSSPTLFGGSGTPPDVGACNKNGTYYALSDNPIGTSPLWADQIGAPAGGGLSACLASSVWDGTTGGLYLSGDATAINGTSYGGSVRQVSPTTGAYIWQTGLPCAVMGTPSLDSSGVLAVGTYSCPQSAAAGAYLLNASTGAIIATLPIASSRVFSQPVFAQGTLFVATESGGLYDFAP
jgi:polyvinyl alcohol dehydrogenase (cytochrome)